MHGQQNDKYTEMQHGQQNDKYTEMQHGQQNDKKQYTYCVNTPMASEGFTISKEREKESKKE